MARDLMDKTYYTSKSKGGKIPVKWTAPEVGTAIPSEKHDSVGTHNYYALFYRLFTIRSTRLTVMCGAMAWCCLRSGQLERNHFQSSQTSKY